MTLIATEATGSSRGGPSLVPSLYQRIESAGISSRVMTGAIIATESLFGTR
jgi:hypothetical protein